MRAEQLREHNLSALLRAVRDSTEPVSRADLAAMTRLTKPTVSKLVDELVGARLLDEGEPLASGGRPKVPLLPASRSLLGVGLSITSDHVSAIAQDLGRKTLGSASVETDVVRLELDALADLCARLVTQVTVEAGDLDLVGVCASVPGRIAPDQRHVLSAPNLGWREVPLRKALAESLDLGEQRIRIENDNRLSVRTEMDSRPGQSFLYVRGGTGVGGAIVVDGNVFNGQRGWAGEIGHMVVTPGGDQCHCGRRGCLEAYISQYALKRRAGLEGYVRIEDLVAALSERMDRDDVIELIGGPLGIAVANTLNVIDFSTVLLSGYLAPIADELTPVVQRIVDAQALAADAGPVVVERADGIDRPALIGAARAALSPVWDTPAQLIERSQQQVV